MIRRVQFTDSFWAEVAEFFPPERDGHGGASIVDFREIILPAIQFQLARGYDELADAQPSLPIKVVLIQTPLGLAGAYAHLVRQDGDEVVHTIGFTVDTEFGGEPLDDEDP